MDSHIDHIDELIGKQLAGEASSEEQRTVDNWMRQNEANQLYYNQVKTIFERTSTIQEWQEFDTDAAWNSLRTKIERDAGTVIPLKPERNYSLYWRIAASVVFILSIGYAGYQWLKVPVVSYVAETVQQTIQDTLPDGSMAFLNKETVVQYEYNPAKKKRKVALTGEAYFSIKQDDKPFVIEVNEIIIEDIGTEFNVKAYPESKTVEVYVESGEVAFYTLSNSGLRLVEGETGIYYKESQSFEKVENRNSNATAYKTHAFTFDKTSLQAIVDQLNSVYGNKVRIGSKTIENCSLTVSFQGEPLQVICEIIAETLKLNIVEKDGEFILEGEGCE